MTTTLWESIILASSFLYSQACSTFLRWRTDQWSSSVGDQWVRTKPCCSPVSWKGIQAHWCKTANVLPTQTKHIWISRREIWMSKNIFFKKSKPKQAENISFGNILRKCFDIYTQLCRVHNLLVNIMKVCVLLCFFSLYYLIENLKMNRPLILSQIILKSNM